MLGIYQAMAYQRDYRTNRLRSAYAECLIWQYKDYGMSK